MKCHCCSGEAKPRGFYRNKNFTVQRYRCVRCGKAYSERQPLDGLRLPLAQAVQIVHLLCEGVGVRAAARLTGCEPKTVLSVLEVAGAKCERLLDYEVRNVNVRQAECDELYSYIYCRPNNAPFNHPTKGEFYTYVAVDRDTKLILSHLVGKRNGENCVAMLSDLKGRLANRIQLSTDGYQGYTGPLGAVYRVFGHEIDYGSEVKQFGPERGFITATTRAPRRFNPPVCKWVRRTKRIGSPDVDAINTSRAERLNLTMRLFSRRFTRCTINYSKKLRNHELAVALFVAHYNFCRVHSAHRNTPAIRAGLTDHVWSIEELFTYGHVQSTTT